MLCEQCARRIILRSCSSGTGTYGAVPPYRTGLQRGLKRGTRMNSPLQSELHLDVGNYDLFINTYSTYADSTPSVLYHTR